jgi:hypothetical protein
VEGSDNVSILYNKAQELAPVGYEFYSNLSRHNENYCKYVDEYLLQDCIITSDAYDIFGRELKSYVAIYKKKEDMDKDRETMKLLDM